MSFGVAVNDRRRNPQTNEWEDYPNFVDCTMFGNRARSLHQYLSKGTKVAIEGKLRWSQWERDGQKRSKLEVIVDELEFMYEPQQAGGRSVLRRRFRRQPGLCSGDSGLQCSGSHARTGSGARAHARCTGYRRFLFRVR